MIYLFDKHKKLKGTVRARHTIALLYERERNGIYSVSAEIPVSLTDKRTVYNYHKKVKESDFIGHYDREGRFQLHKIAAVDIENTSIFIKGIHIFFDEAKAGAIIRERRFRGSEIIDGARVAFSPIGWNVVDFDISDQKDYSFYNVTPLEARAILVETFGYEFDYWLDFDGKNLRNKQIAVKRRIGKETNKRYNYGHNVLSIKVEQDYSEIYTAVIGRGKGEDLDDSDGYGRRIEFTDVEWKKPSKPLDKAKGSRTLIDPTATQLFGYHDGTTVSPRTKVEIFSDIEDESELLQASYDWLMENNVPKAVFSLNVPDGDGLDLGDSVHVIYRDIDLIKSTRVTKVIDDLVSGNRSVEFGDTAYFETDRRISGLKADLKKVGGSASSRIARLKAEFDKRFEDEVQQLHEDFEQALIDAGASVDAVRAEITEEFETAQREFEEEFNQSVADAKKHAEEEAEAKAKQVQDNLDSFAGRHEQLVEELQGSLVDIDGELADARADVSGILGRLTIVDGDISGITGSLNGIQDSLSEVEGTLSSTKTQLEAQVSDARTELEQSISSTRTELENKIGATEEALGKVGEDLGNAKTDLQNQLDEARAELEGLEVGGRNLLPAFTSDKWSHENLTEIEEYSLYFPSGHTGNSIIFLDVEPNTNYTMKFNSDYARYYIYEVLEDGSLGKIIRTTTGSETYTFNTEDISRIRVSLNTFSGNVHEEKNIWNLKLEKGTVATDWTPAPEDTEQKITNINQTITNIEGELSSKVEQTEVDALKGTVTAQGTLLTQTSDEVSSKAEKSVVDTLTGRVTDAESSVTQNAEEIAKRLTKSVYDSDKKATDAKITQWSNTASETAEGLERVIGRVSETEKGVETAQTRIEAEAGRIDGVLSRTSKVEGQVQDAQLAIEANADGLALRATKTEVEQAIDGIEVGGRNLMKNSKIIEHRNHNSHLTFIPSHIGMYTISFDYNIIEENSKITRFLLYSTASGVGSFSGVRPRTSTTQKRVSQTFEVTDNMVGIGIYLYAGSSAAVSRDNKMDFIEIMVEKGTVATDWTPAPEDIDASISEVTDRVTTAEAEIKVHAGEISQKATQSELDRVTGRVSTAETSITQNATEIARRLVKSDYDSDKQATDAEITKWSNLTTETAEGLEQTISRVSTAEGKLSDAELAIKANADSLKLTATKTEVENAIDGIEVGGRNLVLDSEWNERNSKYLFKQFETSEDLIVGEVYTITIYGELGEDRSSFRLYTSNGYSQFQKPDGTGSGGTLSKVKEGVYQATFKHYFAEGYEPSRHDLLRIYQMTSTDSSESYVSRVKLEKGNKATDWTPAPEEAEAKITKAQADIIVNANEIATKVSNSQFDSLSGKVSDNSSAITQTANEVRSKVTQAEVDYSMTHIENGDIKTVKDVASFQRSSSGVTGAILIKTNLNGRAMARVFIKGYNYTTNNTNIDVVISFYNYSTSILQHGYTSTGSKKIERVRIFRDSNGFVNILLNDFDSTWSYPAIAVDRFDMSYVTDWSWGEGWEMSVVDSMPEDVADITEVNGQDYGSIVSKHETDIVQNAKEIALKATQSDLNSVTGRVSSAESKISVQAGQIALRATKKELEGVEGRVSATESSLTVQDEKISGLVTATDGHSEKIAGIVADADSIKQSVSEISGDYVKQSAVKVTSDRVTIGSTSIDGDTLSSVISVSPTAIDLISDKINVTGNVNISGGVTALAVDAIEGNFARLFANELTTDVIKSSHIEASVSLIQKLFVNSARIDELITQSHFVNEMHALTLNVVDLNAAQIRTKILSANTIEAAWLKSDAALIDRIFSSTAQFERMFSKSGFVTSFGSVTISAEQITSGTLRAHNDNFYLNLSTGNIYFRSGANIRFYNEGVALQFSKLNYTVGMSFESHPRQRQYPGVWIGGTSSSSVVADHSTFTGIWAMPQNNELDISARHIRIRSGSGFVDDTERLINIKMDESSVAEIYPSNMTRRYFIGRSLNKFWTVYTENINGIRFTDNEGSQVITRGNNGIEFNDSSGIILIHKGQRYNLDYILNRLAW